MSNVNAKTQERINRIHQVFVADMKPPCYGRDDSECLYVKRGHPGCAIGCTLTPYQKKFVQKKGLNDDGVANLPMSWFSGEDFGFLGNLQNWHDNRIEDETQSERHESLKALAEWGGYTVPDLPQGEQK